MEAEEHFRQRVSAVAYEIAARLGYSDEDKETVRALAQHGAAPVQRDGSWITRLERDLAQESAVAGWTPADVDRFSPVLDTATAFVEGLDYGAYGERPARVILGELRELASEGFLERSAVAALEALCLPAAMAASGPKLRVYPAVLMRVLALMRNPEAALDQIEALAQSDAVLAAAVLRAANSAAYAPAAPVTTISRGLALMGMDQARKVLAAAGARTLFASASMTRLWQHSLEIAAAMEYLASLSHITAPEEAFVTGLIHDIGRLALESIPAEYAAAHRRIGAVCPMLADMVVAGEDHGALGAALLREWGLPEALVLAVEFHHRPEVAPNRLAALVYLAEFATDANEDTPSVGRLRAALRAAGIDWNDGLSEELSSTRLLGTPLMAL